MSKKDKRITVSNGQLKDRKLTHEDAFAALKELMKARIFDYPDDAKMMTAAFEQYRYKGEEMSRSSRRRDVVQVNSSEPNSAEAIMAMEEAATNARLRRPFELIMTPYTWGELLSSEAKEYIVQQMDEGLLVVNIATAAPQREIILQEKKCEIPDYF